MDITILVFIKVHTLTFFSDCHVCWICEVEGDRLCLSVNCCNHNCEVLKHLHKYIKAALRITQSITENLLWINKTAHSVKTRCKRAELDEKQDNRSLLKHLDPFKEKKNHNNSKKGKIICILSNWQKLIRFLIRFPYMGPERLKFTQK